MTRNFLALDFGGGEIVAALAAVDEETNSLRVRYAVRHKSRAFCGSLVRDIDEAQRELSLLFSEIFKYVSVNPVVVIGLRGTFLSFKQEMGFKSIESHNRIISKRDIEAALNNAIPPHKRETLEVVDILPQVFTIDGASGIKKPLGYEGFCLEVETFVSYALITHLNNFNRIISSVGCEEYQIIPSAIALGETLAKPEEKRAGVLVLDIGETLTSAIMYHKEILTDAWELPTGLDIRTQALAELLQCDEETAREELQNYEMGTDSLIDETLENATEKMLYNIKTQLIQTSMFYLNHPSNQIILCGAAADKTMLKLCKKVFSARKARLGGYEHLISDCNLENPAYTGALSLLHHALDREEKHLGIAQAKESGFLDGILDKLGLGQLF